MTIEFFWQLPTAGDGLYADAKSYRRGERDKGVAAAYFGQGVTDPRGTQYNYFDHLHQIAKAAELAHFDGIQVRNDPEGDESWIVAGYLTRSTKNLTVLTEFDASRGSAVYAAKNAVSYQRFSNSRFAWQVSTGGDEKQRHRDGDFVDEADINPRIEEFLTVARNVITQTSYSFKGRFFEVLEGGFKGPLSNQKVPTVYLAGNTAESYALSARQADVHVLDAGHLDLVRADASRLHTLAAAEGRQLRIGLRIDLLARETQEEAEFDAKRYLEQSGGQRAFGNSALWNGLTTKQNGAKATLVGSFEQVAEQLIAYLDAGVSSFILSAIPSLEEAYRIGENVLPALHAHIQATQQRAA
jgi:alkanesulfonate monooxygenase